jgi:hypothetical protein
MTTKDDENRATAFAQLLATIDFEGKPDSEVMALGELMRNWLRTEMADAGTSVDSGAGLSSYDLWVQFGGKRLYINIAESRPITA